MPTRRKPKESAPKKTSERGDYEDHKRRMAASDRAESAKGRDIGGVPDIADIDRRERCRHSLRAFCETYNPDAFGLGWSTDHLTAMARIEEAATLGALFAFAMARGSGKTTVCRMAALWATSYRHCRYAFVIGATDGKARETLDTLRILIRFLPDYAADFPEISWPAQKLAGIANRSSGQTCGGESTLIEWSADRVVLPTVPPPANWPKAWPLRGDGKVPTSGVVVSASGLTGEGIRGSLKTLTTGEMVRPDFVLLDDPQTPESARSKTQNETRLSLITADVLGMAGPGKAIAGVMPCTVIEQGDMIDCVLDRSKHPLWRGERSGILRSMPTDMTAWDAYFNVYARCAQLEPPDFAESNAHYESNRAALEAGGSASWPERKQPGEVSALQSAMHLYFRDRRAFWAEYQNQPQAGEDESSLALDTELLAGKVSNVPRGVVPRNCTRLTAFIDVGLDLLWWTVCAFDEHYGGAVVAYGVYPEQGRTYFAKADPRPGLCDLAKNQSQDAAIYAGLGATVAKILNTTYAQEETGIALPIERLLIDAGWGEKTDLVYDFCRRSPHTNTLLPSHGRGIGASANPMSTWQQRPGERAGRGWRLTPTGSGRHVTVDVNMWKSFVADRLRTPEGAPGCFRIHAGGAHGHALYFDHLTSEVPKTTELKGSGRTVDEWKKIPNRDNDWFDCLVGCAVAASVQGLTFNATGTPAAKAEPRKKVKLSELYAAKNKVRA